MTEAPDIRCLWPAGALLGEGPVWSVRHEGLFWVDIKAPALHLYRPVTEAEMSWPMPERVGSVTPMDDGRILGAFERGFAAFALPEAGAMPQLERLAAPDPHPDHMRFNDGAVAPDGTFWAGSMDDREEEAAGAWYRLRQDRGLDRLAEGFAVTNGPAFDIANGTVYLTDSAKRLIYRAPYRAEGPLQLEPWRQFAPEHGYPDGMTLDAQGRLWVAFWDGACVRALDGDTGAILEEIGVPVPRPTCPAFGGRNLDTLYVTSARIGLDGTALTDAPLSGGLFALTIPGTSGLPQREALALV